MAIALTEFQGLCGFRPVEEIVTFLTSKAGAENTGALQGRAVGGPSKGLLAEVSSFYLILFSGQAWLWPWSGAHMGCWGLNEGQLCSGPLGPVLFLQPYHLKC